MPVLSRTSLPPPAPPSQQQHFPGLQSTTPLLTLVFCCFFGISCQKKGRFLPLWDQALSPRKQYVLTGILSCFHSLKSTPFLIQASKDLPSFPSRAGDQSSSWVCCCCAQGFLCLQIHFYRSVKTFLESDCLDLADWKLKGKQRMAGLISHSASEEQWAPAGPHNAPNIHRKDFLRSRLWLQLTICPPWQEAQAWLTDWSLFTERRREGAIVNCIENTRVNA